MNRVNATIDSDEPVDAVGRQRQEIARELAADIDRHNDLLDASGNASTQHSLRQRQR